jgi:PhnB protein
MRLARPGGKVEHAEINIGDSRIMLADEHPETGALSPKTVGGSPVSIHLYVEDVDQAVERAVAAGAKLVRPVADQFYGDRTGGIEDPFGYRWFIATHKEDLTIEEIQRRAAAQGR